MLKLLLIRPGQTEYDQQGRIQGTLDIPLSEDGRRQSEAASDAVCAERPEVVYASPCQSAQQTAELIGERLGVKVKTIDKLHNLDHGLWQGMLIDEVRTKQPKVYKKWMEQPQTVCPPDGETVTVGKQRVAEALRKLLKKHKEGVIAMVTPEPLASLVRHVMRHEELADLWQSNERCGLWEVIEVPEEIAAGVA